MRRKYTGIKAVGVVIGAVALVVGVSFIGAWIAMLVFGAYLIEAGAATAGPSFFATFFGLWSLAIIGGALHSSITRSTK